MISMRQLATGLLTGVLVLALASESDGAEPVRETITYQGLLNDGGVPANGIYDIKFQYFDELGNPFLTTVAFLEYEVIDGLFSLPIDFTNVFGFGERRFLQVSVRPAGAGVYSDLSPRQEITAAPYSVYAIGAGEADVATVSLDNEWVRSGNAVSAGDGNDRLLLNPELSDGLFVNPYPGLQLNFDNGLYGGIYVNSENSGGTPFYGFAKGNTSRAYIDYEEDFDLIRFFNVGSSVPPLTLGETTATVPTLLAEDEIVKDFGSNQYHRNGPIAYGAIDADGSFISGTPNLSAVWNAANSRYEVSVDGESIHLLSYTVSVTPIGSSPVIASTTSIGGDLAVYLHNLSGSDIQNRFNVVIYKNSAVAVD